MTQFYDDDTISIEDLVSNALPEGSKVIEITGITSGATKGGNNTPYVRFSFKVLESEAGSDVGREGSFDRYLSDKALPMLGRDLYRVGVRGIRLKRFNGSAPEEHAANMASTLSNMVSRRFNAFFTKKKDDRGIDRNEVRLTESYDEPLDLENSPSSY